MPLLLAIAFSVVLLLGLPCPHQSWQSTTQVRPAAVQGELSKVSEHWTKYWKAKQLDQVVALYDDEAVFLTGTGDRFTGKAAIRDLFKQALDSHNTDITVRSIRTEVADKLAYDSGDYRETIVPASGNKLEVQGNYVIVFKRQKSGEWLIVEHVWTDKILSGK